MAVPVPVAVPVAVPVPVSVSEGVNITSSDEKNMLNNKKKK